MNVYLAGLLGFAGVLFVLAGIHNKGTELFTAVTGSNTAGSITSKLPGTSGGNTTEVPGHASPDPNMDTPPGRSA